MRNKTVQFGRILKQSFKGLLRNKMMVFASFLVTVITLTVLGACFAVARNINHQIDLYIEKEYSLSVYLRASISDEEAKGFAKILDEDERVKSYEYVSKEDAYNDYRDNYSEEAFDYIFGEKDKDFLPVSFNITLYDSDQTGELLEKLILVNFNDINAEPGEDEVAENEVIWEYSSTEDLMNKVIKIRNGVNIAGILITALLVFFSVVIISNTIMLSVFARKKEIEIMNHIGATKYYIEGPFIVEGCLIGLAGAVAAVFILKGIYGLITGAMGEGGVTAGVFKLELLPFGSFGAAVIFGLIFVGCVIGGLGAMLAANRHIKN